MTLALALVCLLLVLRLVALEARLRERRRGGYLDLRPRQVTRKPW